MATSEGSAAERVRRDLAAGRPWKARDRLITAVGANPGDQELLEMLGEVYYGMGDLPAAGRFWLVSTRVGADVDAALAAFEERWGSNLGEKLKQVPMRGAVEDYPPPARDRLRELADEAPAAGLVWPSSPRSRASSSDVQAVDEGGTSLYWGFWPCYW